MPFNQSAKTLFASLSIVLLFVLLVNMSTSSQVDASGDSSIAQEEGRFDPLNESEEESEEEEVEEQEEGAEGDRGEEFEEDEDYEDDPDRLMHEVEMARNELEHNIGRLEVVTRLAEIAKDDTAMASYALMHFEEFAGEDERAIEVLEELIESDSVSQPVKNLLKMKLAEVYMWHDREEDSLNVFKSLILKK